MDENNFDETSTLHEMGFAEWRLRNKYWTIYIVPLVVLLLMIYGTWAYCHKLCYERVYRDFGHKATAIGLICTCCVLDALIIAIWVLIVSCGPGHQPGVAPHLLVDSADLENTTVAPNCYQSDPHGYPVWCSNCQSLKVGRTKHSSHQGHCVPRFDHYCVWLGAVIGFKNYRLFVQFVFYFAVLLMIVWITISVYIRDIRQYHARLNANLIVLLIISGIGWLMTSGLFVSYIYYMSQNLTSIEVIDLKKRKRTPELSMQRLYCYYNSDDHYRYVVKLDNDFKGSVYKKHWLKNIKEFMGSNPMLWFIPLPQYWHESPLANGERDVNTIVSPYQEEVGPHTIDYIKKRIESGEYIHKFKEPGREKTHL